MNARTPDMNESRSARLAVLIDADNASAKIADGLFEEIAKIGEASVRRIYGDFSTQRMKGWTDILARHAIIPHQQFAYTTGKNASDITLVIDAMDLLLSGRFDGFCLVSSDSDFTRLASRIREQGVNVYGFGEQKTPESFRQACRRFIYTENLLPERIVPDRDAGPAAPPLAPLAPPSAVAPMLRRVIDQMESEDGWVNLGNFGKQLQNLYTDFDPRTYGHRKLSDLVRKTGLFEVDHPEGGALRIRPKQAGLARTPGTAAAASASSSAGAVQASSAAAAAAPARRKAAPSASRPKASTASKAEPAAATPAPRRAVSKPEAKTEPAASPAAPVPVASPSLDAPLAAPVAEKPVAPVRTHRPLGTPRS